jgi:TfoX/Sxy family transcriptional regulator of competence genes
MLTEVDLVACVRAALTGVGRVTEVKMFGGVGFLLNGNLLAGASARGLLLRVGTEREAEALRQPGARPMVMRGRTMAGYVYVDPPVLSADGVNFALGLAIPYVQTLPSKPRKTARPGEAAKPRKAAQSRPARGGARAARPAERRASRGSSTTRSRKAAQRARGRRAR